MIEFKKIPDGDNEFSISEVVMKLPHDLTIPEMLQEFGCFLKAIGYEFDGEIEVVDISGKEN